MITADQAAAMAARIPKETIELFKVNLMNAITREAVGGMTSTLFTIPTEWEQEITSWLLELGYNLKYAGLMPPPKNEKLLFWCNWEKP